MEQKTDGNAPSVFYLVEFSLLFCIHTRNLRGLVTTHNVFVVKPAFGRIVIITSAVLLCIAIFRFVPGIIKNLHIRATLLAFFARTQSHQTYCDY
jgi:hypothetical protein